MGSARHRRGQSEDLGSHGLSTREQAQPTLLLQSTSAQVECTLHHELRQFFICSALKGNAGVGVDVSTRVKVVEDDLKTSCCLLLYHTRQEEAVSSLFL